VGPLGARWCWPAGSIGSPHLSSSPASGRRALLKERGVEVRHELPGVGANLQDHLQLRLIYKVQGVRTLNEVAGGCSGARPWRSSTCSSGRGL
jgi:choline dehydrogenase